jgi:hypothetical protein
MKDSWSAYEVVRSEVLLLTLLLILLLRLLLILLLRLLLILLLLLFVGIEGGWSSQSILESIGSSNAPRVSTDTFRSAGPLKVELEAYLEVRIRASSQAQVLARVSTSCL